MAMQQSSVFSVRKQLQALGTHLWELATVLFMFMLFTLYSVKLHFVVDIDECSEGSNNCVNVATCSNTDGSFSCACPVGYTGNGTICNGKKMTNYMS